MYTPYATICITRDQGRCFLLLADDHYMTLDSMTILPFMIGVWLDFLPPSLPVQCLGFGVDTDGSTTAMLLRLRSPPTVLTGI